MGNGHFGGGCTHSYSKNIMKYYYFQNYKLTYSTDMHSMSILCILSSLNLYPQDISLFILNTSTLHNKLNTINNRLTLWEKEASGINFITASIANFTSWKTCLISFSDFLSINLNSSIKYSPYSRHLKSLNKLLTILSCLSSHSLFSSSQKVSWNTNSKNIFIVSLIDLCIDSYDMAIWSPFKTLQQTFINVHLNLHLHFNRHSQYQQTLQSKCQIHNMLINISCNYHFTAVNWHFTQLAITVVTCVNKQ